LLISPFNLNLKSLNKSTQGSPLSLHQKENSRSQMKISTSFNPITQQSISSLLPSKTHISFKENEKNLLIMEKELMDFYHMNRSDLHKHFIRSAYSMLKSPSPYI